MHSTEITMPFFLLERDRKKGKEGKKKKKKNTKKRSKKNEDYEEGW